MQMTKQTKNVRRNPFLICILLWIFIFSALLGGILFSIPEKKAENDLCDVYINDIDFCSWNTKTMAFCSYNKGLKNRSLRNEISTTAESTTEEYTGFVMQYGASVRLNKVTGLRFKADISNALAEKVALSDEKSFGFVIAPAYYFEKAMEIDDQTDSNRDYVNDLAHLTEAYGAKPALQLVCEPVEENGKLIIQASVANILYNNTNLTYTAAAYVKTESNSGEISYTYAAYPQTDCLGIARSVSYVATAALNDESANYSEENRAVLREFVIHGIDLAAAFTAEESPLYTERNIELTLETPLSSLAVGESLTLSPLITVAYPQAEQTGKRKILFPLYWRSSAPEIISVTSSGTVIAHGEGSADIYAYIGETKEFWTLCCEDVAVYDCNIINESGYDLLTIDMDSQKIREGDDFTATLSVKEYASYGELSFWIDGALYTTENGVANFSQTISADTVFKIENLSSSLNYFTFKTSTSVSMGTTKILRKELPVKIILPVLSKEKKTLTTIATDAFTGSKEADRCTNLIELTIPENYSTLPSNAFQYCSALEVIYLKNTKLKDKSLLGPNWSGCDALKKIYIPIGTLEGYSKNNFWKIKASCLEERAF